MRIYGDQVFFDQEALLARLTTGARDAKREIVFVVGAPLTSPVSPGSAGVADVRAVTELIRDLFSSEPRQLAELNRQLEGSINPYQTAFLFLQGRRGQDGANRIIRRAVWMARRGKTTDEALDALVNVSEDQLCHLDEDASAWVLSPGVQSLGELIAANQDLFGRAVLTSNFDPLIEISIKKAGALAWRTTLHTDGDLEQSKAAGCQVIHIHGYWHGSDTLHTGNQLRQSRPFLKNSLNKFLSDKTVVVLGYGGWSDIFTSTLGAMVENSTTYPEIIWAFYDEEPLLSDYLKSVLRPGLDRNRVTFYSGIDCHKFMPLLVGEWKTIKISASEGSSSFDRGVGGDVTDDYVLPFVVPKKLECDRPPSIEAWVGREPELKSLQTSTAKVVAICGIGGQGKSTLAAKYLKAVSGGNTKYHYWDWRDCKEEGDRIRTQLIAVIERISHNTVFGSLLQGASDADLVEIFISLSSERPAVFVFDNVDHYVDLEHAVFVGLLDMLVKQFSRSESSSRVVITCRPQVVYDVASFISLPMKGLEVEEAVELFDQRAAQNVSPRQDVEAAHNLTKGHAFWLDLMAVQVARVPGVTLKGLLEDIRRGRGDAPDVLSSIWLTLPERERVVLRVMAETVRPETEDTIEKIVSSDLNYQKFKRALKSLVSLNLVVVKPENNAPDLYDLHPLVRQFVRRSFERPERLSIIQTVLKQYSVIMRSISAILDVYLPFTLLERWSQKAELETEAGLYKEAFKTLSQAGDALIGSGHGEEYVRVARKLFEAIDWHSHSSSVAQFDQVLARLIECLDQLEEFSDADNLLARYEQTIPFKTARYIGYCDVRCHSYWTRGQFDLAVEWGTRGNDLKVQSNVDTAIDCAHNLALAQRDGGDPQSALKYFLGSYSIDELTAPDSHEESIYGAVYGNVGRCLQLMGETRQALICFRKSAFDLESDDSVNRFDNQAYARQWIAEALSELGDRELAFSFYVEAEELCRSAAPARARTIRSAITALFHGESLPAISRSVIKRQVERWINGKVPICSS